MVLYRVKIYLRYILDSLDILHYINIIETKEVLMKYDARVEIQTQWPGRASAGYPSICMKVPASRFETPREMENYLDQIPGLRKSGAKWTFEIGLSEAGLDAAATASPERDIVSDGVEIVLRGIAKDLNARPAAGVGISF